MADDYIERVAGELADLALADEQATGDENIVNDIGDILGSSSQTLQEAFLTAVRVRRAEERARALLAERAGNPIVDKNRLITDEKDAEPSEEEAATDSEAPANADVQDEEDDSPLKDVLDTLDEFLQSEDTEQDKKPTIMPSRPSRG